MRAMSRPVNYHSGASSAAVPTATEWRAHREMVVVSVEDDQLVDSKMMESQAGDRTAISRGEENLWLSSPRSRHSDSGDLPLGSRSVQSGLQVALTSSASLPSDARVERNGQLVLLAVFVSLLGGRFTLQQVSAGLPALDLRWVALAASLVAFLGWVAVARERAAPRVPLHGLMVPFLAWCSWMALSALWVHPPARVAAGLLDFTFLAAFTLLAIAVASRLSAEAVSAVWTWVLLAGLVYFAGAMAGSPDAQGRYAAFGGGPNVFVRVMILAALAAVFLAAKRHRMVFLLALPPLLLGAVLSGSRGGLVAGLAVALLGGVFVLRRLPRRAIPFQRRSAWRDGHPHAQVVGRVRPGGAAGTVRAADCRAEVRLGPQQPSSRGPGDCLSRTCSPVPGWTVTTLRSGTV